MSTKDIIKNSVLENFTADISLARVCISLGLAVVLSLYIFYIYRMTTKSSFYSKEFNKSIALMSVITAAIVLAMQSNLVISLIKNLIPDKVRIPAFIVVIASFVTIIQMLMQAYVPALYGALGVFIPLIVVNCIILGRAEAFASKNGPVASIFDGIGIGLGFTLSLLSLIHI